MSGRDLGDRFWSLVRRLCCDNVDAFLQSHRPWNCLHRINIADATVSATEAGGVMSRALECVPAGALAKLFNNNCPHRRQVPRLL